MLQFGTRFLCLLQNVSQAEKILRDKQSLPKLTPIADAESPTSSGHNYPKKPGEHFPNLSVRPGLSSGPVAALTHHHCRLAWLALSPWAWGEACPPSASEPGRQDRWDNKHQL